MFLKFKRELLRFCFLSFIVATLIILIYYKIFIPFNVFDKSKLTQPTINSSVKYLTEESIVNKIQNTEKIIPLETELSENIIIDNSWGSLGLFKKIKRIQYVGKGDYYLDLSALDKSQVTIDKFSKKITLTLEKPKLNNVYLLNDRTLYETTANGFLRFGEIKLTVEELNIIEREALSRMEKKLSEDSYILIAEENSKELLKKLISSLTKDEFNVDISFKK